MKITFLKSHYNLPGANELTEHSSNTAVLCVKFHKDSPTSIDVMEKQYSTSFSLWWLFNEFKFKFFIEMKILSEANGLNIKLDMCMLIMHGQQPFGLINGTDSIPVYVNTN